MDRIAELLGDIKYETGCSATVSFSWSHDGIKISVAWFTNNNLSRMYFENTPHDEIRKHGLDASFAAFAETVAKKKG